MIRLALFADIHGKFLLPFKLVEYYQSCTGQKIDWIIQCGDMGAFPTKHTMDKATLRHAQHDPDELGFMHDFIQHNPKIADYLQQLNLNMLCVRGNHEDHQFLDQLEQQAGHQPYFSIDAYQRVWVCRSGIPFHLNNEQESISMVGIGRIGDRKGRTDAQFIQPYESKIMKTLAQTQQEIDLLITHDKASESQRGYGSTEIAELLNHIPFQFHFYGHTGEPYQQTLAENGITQSIKIKELEFNSAGHLTEGCMLILEKHGEQFKVFPVPLSYLSAFEQTSWKKFSLQ